MNALSPEPMRLLPRRPDGDPAARCAGPAVVAFVLLPGFDLLSLTAGREPFRHANRHGQGAFFRTLLVSCDGEPVLSAQDIALPVDAGLTDALEADLTLVFGAGTAAEAVPPALPAQLRRLWRMGKTVGAVQGGVVALAQAGVLSGTRFAARPEQVAMLQGRFPGLLHVDQLYAIHNRILTCTGGLAAADLSLRVIHDLAGPAVAQDVMLACQMTAIRDEATPQAIQSVSLVATRNPYLRRALRWVDRNFAREDCLSSMPEAAGTSARHLQRLFKEHLGLRPFKYLLDLRLNRARVLLTETDLSVTDVAEACGFGTGGTFARYFRQRFGVNPSRYTPFGGAA